MFSSILKKSLFLPFHKKLLWLLPCAALGSLFCLGAHLTSGAALQAKQNVHLYYESHAVAYQITYKENSPDNIQNWWQRQDLGMQLLDSQEFVRGYSRRTKFPAFIIGKEERIPVELIIVEDGDENVFPAPVRPDGYFPNNAVTIGIGLSAKHGIAERSLVSVEIPALGAVFTNQVVEKVYNLKEVYLQNYSVYMHRRTASAVLKDAMRAYHVRLAATPFTGLLLSNMQPLIPNSRFVAGAESISYSLKLLEELKKILFEGSLMVNFLAGILYAYALYRVAAQNEKQVRLYCQRNGYPKGGFLRLYAFEFISAAAFTGIFAALFSLIFEKLPFEFLVFAPYTGLYPEFALKISQGIVPLTDYNFLLKSLPAGILIFILSAAGAGVLFKFFEQKGKEMSSLLTLIVVTVVISFMASRPLILFSYAQSARDNALKEHYFGDYILKHKFSDQALSFKAGPHAFALNKTDVDALTAQGFPSLARLEAFGEVAQAVKINEDVSVTNRLSVRFIGLRGKAPAGLEDLLQAIESNQVVIGRNVSDAFSGAELLPFIIYGQKTNISVTLPVIPAQNLDIPFYNNCVFINIDTLAAYIEAPERAASSFLTFGGASGTYLKGLANLNLEITPFKQQKLFWTALEQPASLIRRLVFLTAMGGLALLITACFAASAVRTKEISACWMLWGKILTTSPAYFAAAGAVLAGAFLAALSLVPTLLIPSPMPDILSLSPYTPSLLPFQINGGALFFILFALLLLLGLGYMALTVLQRAYYIKLLHTPALLDTEENNSL